MFTRRIRGVIEQAARKKKRKNELEAKPSAPEEEVPPADLALIVHGVDMRPGDAPPNTRYAEHVSRVPSYAYGNYMKFMLFGFLLLMFAAATVPEQMTRWYVQIPVILLLVGNALVCWAFTFDWDSDSRIIGFGAPAVLPA
ncbi:MAG: hypothetical protein VW644_11450, partial [Alphaproteobacteria bacterium]